MSDVRGEIEPPSSSLELRHASTERPLIVVVPDRRMLVIGGAGHRHAADFRLATTVLRTVDDQLRADLRRIGVIVPKAISEIAWQIPAGWSTSEISQAFGEPTRWQWRQMVEVPKSAPDGAAEAAIDAVRRAGGRDVPLVRVIDYAEGRAAQILHRADENESGSVAKLYRFLDESDLRPTGDLHQLVLADPDLVPTGRARSIFRVPVGVTPA